MKQILFLFFILLTFNLSAQKKSSKFSDDNVSKDIDVVFCLDLSASTNGLLIDLKECYWNLINHSFSLKPAANLRLSLVGFGRPSFSSKNNYVKIIGRLTSNYDSLYEAIDKLGINVEKGDQYVGAALMTCLRETEWSKKKGATKMIILMGNGTVNLGPSNLDDACELAVEKGIIIHTAYCANSVVEKEIKGWENIARLTNGISSLVVINKQEPNYVVQTLSELWTLNKSYNKTIITYGDSGTLKYKYFNKIDSLSAFGESQCLHYRMLYKVFCPEERIKDWDLIAYSLTDGFSLYNIDRNTLPLEFASTVGPDMLNIINDKQQERTKISNEIKTIMEPLKSEIENNRLIKEDISDEGFFNRIVIKSFMKTALSSGFYF